MSLALMAYAIAGGQIDSSGSLANLPLKFHRPYALLWVAWVMFGYFLFRYWLFSGLGPFSNFWREVKLLTYDFGPLRRAANDKYKTHLQTAKEDRDRELKMKRADQGWMPMITRKGRSLALDERQIWSPRRQSSPSGSSGVADIPLPRKVIVWYAVAHIVAIPRAMLFERAFSDQLLPYLVAAIAIGANLWTHQI